jgi:hypothetical protein
MYNSIGMAGVKSDEAEEVQAQSVLQSLISHFDKANAENGHNTDRLANIMNKLNLDAPSPKAPEEKVKRNGLTSGEGLLAAIEGMVNKYQDLNNIQHSILSRLEKLV